MATTAWGEHSKWEILKQNYFWSVSIICSLHPSVCEMVTFSNWMLQHFPTWKIKQVIWWLLGYCELCHYINFILLLPWAWLQVSAASHPTLFPPLRTADTSPPWCQVSWLVWAPGRARCPPPRAGVGPRVWSPPPPPWRCWRWWCLLSHTGQAAAQYLCVCQRKVWSWEPGWHCAVTNSNGTWNKNNYYPKCQIRV